MAQPSKWLFPFNTFAKVTVLVSLLVFGLMIRLAFYDHNSFDEHVFNSIPHQHVWLTNFMHAITRMGNTEVLIFANCLLVVFLIINGEKQTAIQVALVASSSVLLMSLLKRSFHRVRPPQPLIEGITNYSFPSGHAFMSLAFYGLMMWWSIIHLKEKWQQRAAISFFVLILILIGFSRIYLRVHYTTDVIAGFSMSLAWLIISLSLTDHFIKKPSRKRQQVSRS